MCLTYIGIIRGKKNHLVIENLRLLDKMHEGIMVVSMDDLSLKFANKPAKRILKQQQKTVDTSFTDISDQKAKKEENLLGGKDLDKKMFKLTKISIAEGGGDSP